MLRMIGALGLLTIAGSTASAAIVYSNNFTVSAGPEWSNNTIATSNGEKFLGTSANGFGNGTDTLTLTGLSAHSVATITFDLYIIQSWDGNGPGGGGPDNWRLTVDAVDKILTNFANFTGGNTQAYPNMVPPLGPGGANAPRTGATDAGHLGFGTGDFGDATYHFSLALAHSSSSIVIDFTSLQNQAPGDEGWGLDNVSVDINSTAGVPEPTAWSMMLAGAGLVYVSLRRKQP